MGRLPALNEVKRWENKEVKNIVMECANGLPPRKVQIWTKFLKDFRIICKEDNDGLYNAGRHVCFRSTAFEMQMEV